MISLGIYFTSRTDQTVTWVTCKSHVTYFDTCFERFAFADFQNRQHTLDYNKLPISQTAVIDNQPYSKRHNALLVS